MPQRYEIGQTVKLPAGTELNRGNNEDSDSVVVLKSIKVVVVGPRKDGGIEVVIPAQDKLRPLYWHQPESKI